MKVQFMFNMMGDDFEAKAGDVIDSKDFPPGEKVLKRHLVAGTCVEYKEPRTMTTKNTPTGKK